MVSNEFSAYQEFTPEALLGPLNDVEQKHVPKQLFAAGDTSLLRTGARVAIVGSRQASPEGLFRARRLAALLCSRGIVVVSGLALGIDTAAHTEAIKRSGQTIAVIGTPLDQCYPKSNAALQRQIMQDYLCLSQFPVGMPVQPKNFPLRNRTMALISDATVIIEASDTSGSLKQGWEALRLGRGLFMTQAIANDPGVSWPKKMQDYGAHILSDATLEAFLDALPKRTEAYSSGPIPF
jgi:DNA processing protein